VAVGSRPSWFCLQVNGQRLKGVRDAERFLARVARDIFEQDLHEVAVVGERFDDDVFESHAESYFFVRCSNYPCHVEKLKGSAVISRALPSTESPVPVTEEEVRGFKLSGAGEEAPPLREGDIVHVRRGYLENLVGIVCGPARDGRCCVGFRLFTRRFEEALPPSNLRLLGSVADHSRSARADAHAR
jgi:hypothetical protein